MVEKKSTAEARYAKRTAILGSTVKTLRHRAGATLQVLAERSGLSSSTISKIENGQLSPTYETILRLADGLSVDISALFEGSDAPAPGAGRRSVTLHGNGHKYQSPHYSYEFLAPELSHKHFIPIFTTINSHNIEDFKNLSRHDGEEFIYVLNGEVDFYSAHYAPTRLAAGDSCYIDSQMGHACVSVGEEDAQILWVTSRSTLDKQVE